MNKTLLFPPKISDFVAWYQASYLDSLKRRYSPKIIQKDLWSNFAHTGWAPDWVLLYSIIEAQLETHSLTEELREQFIKSMDCGDLNHSWFSLATKEIILPVPQEIQAKIRNEICTEPIWVKPKLIKTKIARGNFCAIPLHDGTFGFIVIISMLSSTQGIVQLDKKVFLQPPTERDISELDPLLPPFGTDLYLATVGYWSCGMLDRCVQAFLPTSNSNELKITTRSIYPDGIASLVEEFHGCSPINTLYSIHNSPLNQNAKQCRIVGKAIPKPSKNYGWQIL